MHFKVGRRGAVILHLGVVFELADSSKLYNCEVESFTSSWSVILCNLMFVFAQSLGLFGL